MSLINTRMQNMRAKGNLDKWELRPSRYGVLDLFLQQGASPTGIITPELKAKAAASIGSTLQVPVIDYDGGVTIGNTRTVTIADSENTSQLVTVVFATYAWGFTVVPSMFSNNEISIQRDFETKFNKYLYKFAETLDAAGKAALEANKSQIYAELLQYALAGNAVTATWAQREEIIGDIEPIVNANDFYGQKDVVGNAGLESLIRKLAEQGLYNDKNKQIQYSDKILHWSNRITNDAGDYATFFVVPEGSLGVLTRFERESILGTKSRTGHEWGIESLPLLNMPVGTYYYESVGDFNAIGGAATADLTRAMKQHYGFAVDVAFVVAYNSDPVTKAGAISKMIVSAT